MKKTVTIIFCLLSVLWSRAQFNFKTIVPKTPVIAGESFQVQFIIENADRSMTIRPPVFNNFRVVAGPNVHMGSVTTVNGPKPLRNAVYTLEAIMPGRFMIPGATVLVYGRTFRSNNVFVEVISKEEAAKKYNRENEVNPSDYFLAPGENAYQKIRQNLFIKVLVDRTSCFVGEPVLATYKLYSRLESRSDIVKNPGFYGFTVYDMVNLSDKQVAAENVNGKLFDVHTIRKVQLYPLQAGVFTIDPMEVKNKVEFSKSAVNKKAEQEVMEGILGSDAPDNRREGTELFETNISTEPVMIEVKPVPEKNKPALYTGATGHFTISAATDNDSLAKNEQGFFEITLAGKGNFIQLLAPVVQWPAGVEGFDPVIQDDLDKTKIPLTGSRTFRFPFVCAAEGKLQLPVVSFSFFDTDSNSYKTISTKLPAILVGKEKRNIPVSEERKTSIAATSEKAARTAAIVVAVGVILIVVYWSTRKKERVQVPVEQKPAPPSFENLLEPAYAAILTGDHRFYSILQGILWKYAAEKFNLSGSEMNKQELAVKMNTAGLDDITKTAVMNILTYCEAGLYTTADLQEDKAMLLGSAVAVLKKMDTVPGDSLPGYELRT